MAGKILSPFVQQKASYASMNDCAFMLKLGEYSEEEAKTLAGHLKDAGMKVEMKGLVLFKSAYSSTLDGKLSEVEGKAEGIDRFKKYVATIKTLMEKDIESDKFTESFLSESIPGWKEKLERLETAKKAEKAGESAIPEEEKNELLWTAAECISAMNFVEDFLGINMIDIENPGTLADDPMVVIPVKAEDYNEDEPLLHMRMDVEMNKAVEIAVDEFSTTRYDNLDDEFREDFSEEFLIIRSMGILIGELVERAEKGKMDIDDFADLCYLEMGDKNTMTVDASLVAEEIARSLEKTGMLKVKGDIIKWKI